MDNLPPIMNSRSAIARHYLLVRVLLGFTLLSSLWRPLIAEEVPAGNVPQIGHSGAWYNPARDGEGWF